MLRVASGIFSKICGHKFNNSSNPLSGLDVYINLFFIFLGLFIFLKLSISIPLLIMFILFVKIGYFSINKFLCHSVKHIHPFIELFHLSRICVSFNEQP